LFNGFQRLRLGQFFKNMLQITIGLQSIKSGGFNQTVKVGTGLGPFDGIRKNPVIATNYKGSEARSTALLSISWA